MTACQRQGIEFLTVLLAVFVAGRHPLAADEPPFRVGDSVLTASEAPLLVGNQVRLRVPSGRQLTVLDTRGSFVLVEIEAGGKRVKGWLDVKHLAAVPPPVTEFALVWAPTLGLYYGQATADLAGDLGIPTSRYRTPLIVVRVGKGSAADLAGIRDNDVLINIPDELLKSPGKQGRLRVFRDGQTRDLDITSRDHDLRQLELGGTGVARAQPRQWVVDPAGAGDYRTITAAINAALPGDTVVLREGYYQEEVLPRSGVTLRSTPDAAIAWEANRPLMMIGASDVTIEGLAVTGRNQAILAINSRNVVVRNCRLGAAKPAVVAVDHAVEMVVEKCMLDGNADSDGIVVDASQVTIRRSTLSRCKQAVILTDSSQGSILDNTLLENDTAVLIRDSKSEIHENTILAHRKAKGVVLANADVEARDNSIRHVGFGVVANPARGRLSGNTISQCLYGIVFDGGTLAVENCTILNNARGILGGARNVEPMPSRQLTIQGNTISGNGDGVWLAKCDATVTKNLIEGNINGVVLDSSSTAINHNTFALQTAAAIQVRSGSRARVNHNIIAFNGVGLRVDAAADLQSSYNNVFSNLATKEFPLRDGNFVRVDHVLTQGGERIPVMIFPAYDLQSSTDISADPLFVAPGSDYHLRSESPVLSQVADDGQPIGAFGPAEVRPSP